eukprot:Rhum_TRINITY_DN16514_c0_g1::Rhum_TRINITY_DN16514_c0_g1_i1::g.163484::m.163484
MCERRGQGYGYGGGGCWVCVGGAADGVSVGGGCKKKLRALHAHARPLHDFKVQVRRLSRRCPDRLWGDHFVAVHPPHDLLRLRDPLLLRLLLLGACVRRLLRRCRHAGGPAGLGAGGVGGGRRRGGLRRGGLARLHGRGARHGGRFAGVLRGLFALCLLRRTLRLSLLHHGAGHETPLTWNGRRRDHFLRPLALGVRRGGRCLAEARRSVRAVRPRRLARLRLLVGHFRGRGAGGGCLRGTGVGRRPLQVLEGPFPVHLAARALAAEGLLREVRDLAVQLRHGQPRLLDRLRLERLETGEPRVEHLPASAHADHQLSAEDPHEEDLLVRHEQVLTLLETDDLQPHHGLVDAEVGILPVHHRLLHSLVNLVALHSLVDKVGDGAGRRLRRHFVVVVPRQRLGRQSQHHLLGDLVHRRVLQLLLLRLHLPCGALLAGGCDAVLLVAVDGEAVEGGHDVREVDGLRVFLLQQVADLEDHLQLHLLLQRVHDKIEVVTLRPEVVRALVVLDVDERLVDRFQQLQEHKAVVTLRHPVVLVLELVPRKLFDPFSHVIHHAPLHKRRVQLVQLLVLKPLISGLRHCVRDGTSLGTLAPMKYRYCSF